MTHLYFCEKCGKILQIKKEEHATFGYCKCGYAKHLHSGVRFSQKENHEEELGTGIAHDEITQGYPNTCKKCGFGYSEIEHLNPFYSDESDIYLYKCKKCGHVERQTDGTSNK